MIRPSDHSPEINQRIADEIYPAVLEWLEEEDSDQERDQIKKDLASALGAGARDDGYSVLRHLDDRCYWTMNVSFYAVLRVVPGLRHRFHEEAVRQYLLENKIVPEFTIGSAVQFKQDGASWVGEITRINADQGTYDVYCEALKHVRSGPGIHATILPFEAVTAHVP